MENHTDSLDWVEDNDSQWHSKIYDGIYFFVTNNNGWEWIFQFNAEDIYEERKSSVKFQNAIEAMEDAQRAWDDWAREDGDPEAETKE